MPPPARAAALLAATLVIGCGLAAGFAPSPVVPVLAAASSRINRAVELLASGQPIYYDQVSGGGYEDGKRLASTWADYITYDLEHSPFDMTALRTFMQGLVDAGRTRSGHRTPAVIVVLPFPGVSAEVVRANSWMVEQALGAGAHGVLLVHAREPEAVRAFVQAARYPHAPVGRGIAEGLRGAGGESFPARIWGLSDDDYRRRADPWPLNPDGELLLGIKVEDRHALERAEESIAVPGLGFAEWGPSDMRLSFNAASDDDPRLRQARSRVLAATKKAGIAFLNQVNATNIIQMLDEGVRIGSGAGAEAAEMGRRHTQRTMPW